jgi:hypothetical protein
MGVYNIMNRITRKDLEQAVRVLNRLAGQPESDTGWVPDDTRPNGSRAIIGQYVLSGAYGGWRLEQIISEGGGIKAITQGFEPARVTYGLIVAYTDGMIAKE